MKMEFRKLKASEIDIRIGTVVDGLGCSLLLYQNARCGMDILDEVVGAENWQREHYEVKGNMFCRVGIKCGTEWVWKSDCGTESQTEKQKGEASDSFKRACVNWGIGRELYTAPFIWVPLDKFDFENGKIKKSVQKKINKFKVSRIDYDCSDIMELVIVDGEGSVVFKWKW